MFPEDREALVRWIEGRVLLQPERTNIMGKDLEIGEVWCVWETERRPQGLEYASKQETPEGAGRGKETAGKKIN